MMNAKWIEDCVAQIYQILIADRNPRVREFLKREMAAEGYRVWEAENMHEILKWTSHIKPLDLLIIDPDLPDADDVYPVEQIVSQFPNLPVIIHTINSDSVRHPVSSKAKAVIEKGGNSVETLKTVINDFFYKLRFTKVSSPAEV